MKAGTLKAQARRKLDAVRAEQVVAGLDHGTSVDAKHWGGYCLWRGPSYDPRRLGGAPRLLDAAVAAAPGDAEALAWRGRARRLAGDAAGARRDLRAALRLDGRLAYARAALGELDRETGEAGWEAAFEAAAKTDPSMPWTYLWRAGGSLKEGRLGDAQKDLEAAGDTGRGLFLGRVLSGILAVRLRDFKGAAAEFDAAAGLDPSCPGALVMRGQARLWDGAEAAAAADFEAAVRVDHDCKVAYYSFLGCGDLPDTPEGLSTLDAAVRGRPEAPWTWALRGELKRMPNLALYDEATADLRKACALRPRSPWLQAFLGRSLGNTGRGPEGLERIDEAIRLDPDCGWLHGWRGEALRKARRFEEAEAALTRAVELSPGYIHAWAWRGTLYRQLGRARAAVADLDRAVDLNPLYDLSYHNRALALLASGEEADAMLDMERAARMNPKYAWFDGPAAGREAEAREVLASLAKAARRDDSGRSLAWLGETRLKTGDLDGAVRDLSAAARRAPRWGWAHAWLGEALVRGGRHREAIRALERAAKLDPEYPRAWAWKGVALAALGRLPEALDSFDASLKLDQKTAWAWAWRAEARLRGGDAAGAVSDYGRALSLDPRSFEARRGRGEALRALGKAAEAAAELDTAVATAPGDPRALVARALARQDLGRHEDSLFDFAAAVKASPGLLAPAPRRQLAQQLAELGGEAAARAAVGADPGCQGGWLALAEALRGRDADGVVAALGKAWELGEYAVWLWLIEPGGKLKGLLRRAAAGPGGLAERRMLGEEDYERMFATLDGLLEGKVPAFWARRLRGEAALKTGRWSEAARDLGAAARRVPGHAKTWAFLAEARWRLGRSAEAKKAFDRAVAASGEAWALAWRGQFLLRTGDPKAAAKDLERALKLDPKHAWSHGWLGACRLLGGDARGALKALDKGLTLDPRDVEARIWRAEARLAVGNPSGALKDIGEVLRLVPGHRWALLHRFLLLRKERDLVALRGTLFGDNFRRRKGAAAEKAARALLERAGGNRVV
ncbi:MAG: tetratricopeptide repeat protein [Elusimicrobia bacterium]|nr:tetratricopeptide repeat protein [Elusimicrobiota bacterium]